MIPNVARLYPGLMSSLLCLEVLCDQGFGQTAVYIVRHAEKANNTANSPLSEQGLLRAQALAKLLKATRIKEIYTSQFTRTKQTAQPLAMALHVPSTEVENGDADKTFSLIREHHLDHSVLIVGHSDSIGPLINKWVPVSEVAIDQNEYDAIFILIPMPDGVGWTRLKYAAQSP